MTNYQQLSEIARIKTRISNLQTQSDILKKSFFDYIEGLNSEYKVMSNINRENFTFDIYGNKLKLKATYFDNETSYQGKLSVLTITFEGNKELHSELFYWMFDRNSNIKSPNNTKDLYAGDFSEDFFIEIMNKLIESNKFEL